MVFTSVPVFAIDGAAYDDENSNGVYDSYTIKNGYAQEDENLQYPPYESKPDCYNCEDQYPYCGYCMEYPQPVLNQIAPLDNGIQAMAGSTGLTGVRVRNANAGGSLDMPTRSIVVGSETFTAFELGDLPIDGQGNPDADTKIYELLLAGNLADVVSIEFTIYVPDSFEAVPTRANRFRGRFGMWNDTTNVPAWHSSNQVTLRTDGTPELEAPTFGGPGVVSTEVTVNGLSYRRLVTTVGVANLISAQTPEITNIGLVIEWQAYSPAGHRVYMTAQVMESQSPAGNIDLTNVLLRNPNAGPAVNMPTHPIIVGSDTITAFELGDFPVDGQGNPVHGTKIYELIIDGDVDDIHSILLTMYVPESFVAVQAANRFRARFGMWNDTTNAPAWHGPSQVTFWTDGIPELEAPAFGGPGVASAEVMVNGLQYRRLSITINAADIIDAQTFDVTNIGLVFEWQSHSPAGHRVYMTAQIFDSPPPPSDASLNNLTISAGELTPAFASATLAYTARVLNHITSITVTPTASDTGVTITVNGAPVNSGEASAAINLNEGTNNIAVVVTAPDNSAQTYTIVVTRAEPPLGPGLYDAGTGSDVRLMPANPPRIDPITTTVTGDGNSTPLFVGNIDLFPVPGGANRPAGFRGDMLRYVPEQGPYGTANDYLDYLHGVTLTVFFPANMRIIGGNPNAAHFRLDYGIYPISEASSWIVDPGGLFITDNTGRNNWLSPDRIVYMDGNNDHHTESAKSPINYFWYLWADSHENPNKQTEGELVFIGGVPYLAFDVTVDLHNTIQRDGVEAFYIRFATARMEIEDQVFIGNFRPDFRSNKSGGSTGIAEVPLFMDGHTDGHFMDGLTFMSGDNVPLTTSRGVNGANQNKLVYTDEGLFGVYIAWIAGNPNNDSYSYPLSFVFSPHPTSGDETDREWFELHRMPDSSGAFSLVTDSSGNVYLVTQARVNAQGQPVWLSRQNRFNKPFIVRYTANSFNPATSTLSTPMQTFAMMDYPDAAEGFDGYGWGPVPSNFMISPDGIIYMVGTGMVPYWDSQKGVLNIVAFDTSTHQWESAKVYLDGSRHTYSRVGFVPSFTAPGRYDIEFFGTINPLKRASWTGHPLVNIREYSTHTYAFDSLVYLRISPLFIDPVFDGTHWVMPASMDTEANRLAGNNLDVIVPDHLVPGTAHYPITDAAGSVTLGPEFGPASHFGTGNSRTRTCVSQSRYGIPCSHGSNTCLFIDFTFRGMPVHGLSTQFANIVQFYSLTGPPLRTLQDYLDAMATYGANFSEIHADIASYGDVFWDSNGDLHIVWGFTQQRNGARHQTWHAYFRLNPETLEREMVFNQPLFTSEVAGSNLARPIFMKDTAGNYFLLASFGATSNNARLYQFTSFSDTGWRVTELGRFTSPSFSFSEFIVGKQYVDGYMFATGFGDVTHFMTHVVPIGNFPGAFDWVVGTINLDVAPEARDAVAQLNQLSDTVAQTIVNTQAEALAWMNDIVSGLGFATNVTILSFAAAVAGTEANVDGTDGLFNVAALLLDGDRVVGTFLYTINITASGYEPQQQFVPVTGITGVPTRGTAGVALALTGTVAPATATNRTIVWSVVSGQATITGNTITATAAGPVVVIATIVDGEGAGTDFEAEFTINFVAASTDPDPEPAHDPGTATPSPPDDPQAPSLAPIIVEEDGVTVTIPVDTQQEWADETGKIPSVEVDITVTPPEEEGDVLLEIDLGITVGNNTVEEVNTPVAVEVCLDGVNLDEVNPDRIVAITADGTLIAGIFDSETGTFIFETRIIGSFEIAYISSLLWLQLQIGSYNIYDVAENMRRLPIDLDVAPIIVDNRTLVPLRFVAYALGAEVDWYHPTRTVTITYESRTLSFAIGELAPGMDVPAQIISNRTMVPLRFVIEFFEAEVSWDPVARTIMIIVR